MWEIEDIMQFKFGYGTEKNLFLIFLSAFKIQILYMLSWYFYYWVGKIISIYNMASIKFSNLESHNIGEEGKVWHFGSHNTK